MNQADENKKEFFAMWHKMNAEDRAKIDRLGGLFATGRGFFAAYESFRNAAGDTLSVDAIDGFMDAWDSAHGLEVSE